MSWRERHDRSKTPAIAAVVAFQHGTAGYVICVTARGSLHVCVCVSTPGHGDHFFNNFRLQGICCVILIAGGQGLQRQALPNEAKSLEWMQWLITTVYLPFVTSCIFLAVHCLNSSVLHARLPQSEACFFRCHLQFHVPSQNVRACVRVCVCVNSSRA